MRGETLSGGAGFPRTIEASKLDYRPRAKEASSERGNTEKEWMNLKHTGPRDTGLETAATPVPYERWVRVVDEVYEGFDYERLAWALGNIVACGR